MTAREFKERLSRRARKAGLDPDDALCERLWVYFQLLAKWNAKINLTSLDLDDPTPDALDRLLIEPLLAARHAMGATALIDRALAPKPPPPEPPPPAPPAPARKRRRRR